MWPAISVPFLKNAARALLLTTAFLVPAYAHEHHAPHGGSLVEIGEEFAHIELVADQDSGRFTAYTLDGEAENPVRIAQKEIRLRVSPATVFVLKGVENPLSGETLGDTSEFSMPLAGLKALPAQTFKGHVEAVNIKGVQFKNLPFVFAGGMDAKK